MNTNNDWVYYFTRFLLQVNFANRFHWASCQLRYWSRPDHQTMFFFLVEYLTPDCKKGTFWIVLLSAYCSKRFIFSFAINVHCTKRDRYLLTFQRINAEIFKIYIHYRDNSTHNSAKYRLFYLKMYSFSSLLYGVSI